MKTRTFGLLVLPFLLFSISSEAKSTRLKVELGDRTLTPIVDEPKGEGPHPILVMIGDATGSIADAPFKKLVRSATRDGFVTVRLEWSYKEKKGAPSEDLKREAEELRLVVTEILGSRMMQQHEVDPQHVALFAEGIGARVAMLPESGVSKETVKALLLQDPVCSACHSSNSLWVKKLGWVAKKSAKPKKPNAQKYIRGAQSAGTHP
jgi:hypothetical protein